MTELHHHTFHALGSRNEIALYSEDATRARDLFSLVEHEVRRIEEKYSRYRAESIVSQINHAAGSHAIAVDEETARLIDFALACFKQSGGMFDFTSGILRQVWDFSNPVIPSSESIKSLLGRIGWQHVVWQRPHLFLKQPGMEIDFGGFGKEYAVDQAIELLKSKGADAAYVNLGGDLRVIGLPPGRFSWHFGIAHPRAPGQVAFSLEVRSGALASSGDYERFFEVDGCRYCHILNPLTGYPVTELQSVSVVAPAAMLAGSCSTIAMLLGKKRAKQFLKRMGFPYTLIDSTGQITHG